MNFSFPILIFQKEKKKPTNRRFFLQNFNCNLGISGSHNVYIFKVKISQYNLHRNFFNTAVMRLPLSNKGYVLHFKAKPTLFLFYSFSCNMHLAHFCDIHKQTLSGFLQNHSSHNVFSLRDYQRLTSPPCVIFYFSNSNIFDCLGITSLSFYMFATSLQLMSNSKFYLGDVSSVWPIK